MSQDRSNEKDTLVILWTSQDPEVAKNMVFMYAKNSRLKGWWKKVRLIVWGPSANLMAASEELQAELRVLIDAGVEVLACKACSDRYGVSEKLKDLGIDVIYMGEPLTGYLKSGMHLISI
jgi:hypothetical protein